MISQITNRNYVSDLKQFDEWCKEHQRSPWDEVAVCDYLTSRTVSFSSVNRIIAAISKRNTILGLNPLDRKLPRIRCILQNAPNPKRQKDRIQWRDVESLLSRLANSADLLDARDAALIGLIYFAKVKSVEATGLDWLSLGSGIGFMSIADEGETLELVLEPTRYTRGRTRVVFDANPLSVAAIQRWTNIANIQNGEPLFRAVDQHRHVSKKRLTTHGVRNIVKSRFVGGNYSSESLRPARIQQTRFITT